MGKTKSQISVFAIAGIVLIIIVGVFLFIRYTSQRASIDETEGQAISSKMDQEFLNSYISHCVKQTVIEGEKRYGLNMRVSPDQISAYVTYALPYCVNNFYEFRRQDFSVEAGTPIVKTKISTEALITEVIYPVRLEKQGTVLTFDKASYTYPRTVTATLDPKKTTTVVSADGSMILEVPPGTKVTVDGKEVNEVGLKQLDRNFNGLSNGVLAGKIAFNGMPHGAEFSQPVKLTLYYEDMDVPPYIDEDNLKLGYYEDTTFKNWIGLPTYVDSVKNKLVINTTHFSVYGSVINCGSAGEPIKQINTVELISEKCGPCDDGKWTYKAGDTKIGEIYHLKEGIKLIEEDAIPLENWEKWEDGKGLLSEIIADGDKTCKSVPSIFKIGEVETPTYWPTEECNTYLGVVKCEKEIHEGSVSFETPHECEDANCKDNIDCETTTVMSCKADLNYYVYNKAVDLKGRVRYEVAFGEEGESCLPSEGVTQAAASTAPSEYDVVFIVPSDGNEEIKPDGIFDSSKCGYVKEGDSEDNCVLTKDKRENVKVKISPICYKEDTCKIIGVHLEDSKLVFYVEAHNDKFGADAPDACLTGSAMVQLLGAGVQGIYSQVCDKDAAEYDNTPIGMGGQGVIDYVGGVCKHCGEGTPTAAGQAVYTWGPADLSETQCMFLCFGNTPSAGCYCPSTLIGKLYQNVTDAGENLCLQCVPFNQYYGIWETPTEGTVCNCAAAPPTE